MFYHMQSFKFRVVLIRATWTLCLCANTLPASMHPSQVTCYLLYPHTFFQPLFQVQSSRSKTPSWWRPLFGPNELFKCLRNGVYIFVFYCLFCSAHTVPACAPADVSVHPPICKKAWPSQTQYSHVSDEPVPSPSNLFRPVRLAYRLNFFPET